MASGQIPRVRFEREHNFTHSSGTIGLTNLPDMTSPAASRRLQNATKYCKKCIKWVQPENCGVFQLLFKPEELTFYTDIQSSMPIKSAATPDMTPTATFGLHLLKFEKTAENVAFNGFGSNFSGTACNLAQPIGGLLEINYDEVLRCKIGMHAVQ